MNSVAHHLNLVHMAKRHHKRAMLKEPSLPAPVNGGGKVLANGSLKVAVPLVDGTTAIYGAVPVTEWYFHREAQAPRRNGHATVKPLTPAALIQRGVEMALSGLVEVERRARAAEQPSSSAPIAAE
jgi:hypothetical protein